MASSKPRVMLCNCEKTMRLDAGRIAGLDKDHTVHTQLCRAQMASFEKALATGEPLLIACTQEAPLFQEVAEERGADQELSFVNIRERAGWCATSTDPHSKISALLAEALAPSAPAALHSIESDGVCLVMARASRRSMRHELLKDVCRSRCCSATFRISSCPPRWKFRFMPGVSVRSRDRWAISR